MPIETIRISKSGRDQLLTLKRRTKIGTWNVLCRWAFCVSIAEKTTPQALSGDTEAALEISVDTMFGAHAPVYLALLKTRCKRDGLSLSDHSLNVQLRVHIHRGIAYLAGARDMASIRDLCAIGANRMPAPDSSDSNAKRAVG
jgi:DNA sulfur modification protein DndE